MYVYSIHDKVAGTDVQYFTAENNQAAARQMLAVMRDPNTVLSQFPGDYEVVCFGELNEELVVAKCDLDKLTDWYEGGANA